VTIHPYPNQDFLSPSFCNLAVSFLTSLMNNEEYENSEQLSLCFTPLSVIDNLLKDHPAGL